MEKEDLEKIIKTETFENPFCRYERVLAIVENGYCIFELMVREDEILLNCIRVAESDIGNGFGQKGLEWLIDLSEKSRFLIRGIISPCSHKKMNFESLANWYQKNGFLVDGSNITYFPKSLYNKQCKKIAKI